MNPIALTDMQYAILCHAVERTASEVKWFPKAIRGCARLRLRDSLYKSGLIEKSDGNQWRVSVAGNAVIQRAKTEYAVQQHGTKHAMQARQMKQRSQSKQSDVITLLQRPEGATVNQICAMTGWQVCTVHGMFANVIKKKRGMTLVSMKQQGQDRVYHINAT